MKIRDVLGLNSRNHLYTSVYNSRKAKIRNSPLTKNTKRSQGQRTETYSVINSMEALEKFDFEIAK